MGDITNYREEERWLEHYGVHIFTWLFILFFTIGIGFLYVENEMKTQAVHEIN